MIQKNRCLILLLILLCVGCSDKHGEFVLGFNRQCMEDFIDVRILFFKQNNGNHFILDAIPFVPFLRVAFEYKTAIMQAQMTIRNGYNIKWTVLAEGKDRDIDWGLQGQADVPIVGGVPVGYSSISPYREIISKLVQRTIRNGFEQLKTAKDEHESWNILIEDVSDEGEISISFGSSHGLKEGEILPIYSKYDLENRSFEQFNEQYCQDMQDNEHLFLAVGKITDIEKNKSTLEIILQSEDSRPVQVGDIIKSVSKNDNKNANRRRRRSRTLRGRGNRASVLRERRNHQNIQNIVKTKKSLRLGFIYANMDLSIGGRISRHNIAPLVRVFIFEEASEFGFQISTGRYNHYNPYYNQNR